MSAMCGVLPLDGQPLAAETLDAMMAPLQRRLAHGSGVWCGEAIGLGHCRLPITPEALHERLPLRDEAADVTITADAIIDNREELFGALSVPHAERAGMADSQLILKAYGKWAEACPRHLVGDFAFAVWDGARQSLFCARDQCGYRTFYYHTAPGLFAFSTLMEPLLALPGVGREWDETWVADYLAIPSVMHELDPELTLYRSIRQLPPAHTLTVRRGAGVRTQCYWRLEDVAPVRLGTDAEYEEAFREVFFEAVRCRLRSVRPVGVMLSGGLDSGSVACVAARLLRERGETLTAFTAIPMADYKDYLPKGRLADESGYVEAVREHAGNIEAVFSRSEGRDSLSDTERYFDILEQPYKIIENLFWADGLRRLGQERGIGVMLTGQLGNATISWGNAMASYARMVRRGEWGRLLYEVREHAAVRKVHPARVLVGVLVRAAPEPLRRMRTRLSARRDRTDFSAPIHPDFARRMAVGERLRRAGLVPARVMPGSVGQRMQMLQPAGLAHLGAITTKIALAHDMVTRDPTGDVRVIEFCLGLPDEQYVRGGQPRRLVRRAMQGIMPDVVRLNISERGRQSADWLQRLAPRWDEIRREVDSLAEMPAARRYLHIDKMCDIMAGEFPRPSVNDTAYRVLVRGVVFARFLRRL